MLILDPVRHLCGDRVSMCGGVTFVCSDGVVYVRNVLFTLHQDPHI